MSGWALACLLNEGSGRYRRSSTWRVSMACPLELTSLIVPVCPAYVSSVIRAPEGLTFRLGNAHRGKEGANPKERDAAGGRRAVLLRRRRLARQPHGGPGPRAPGRGCGSPLPRQ